MENEGLSLRDELQAAFDNSALEENTKESEKDLPPEPTKESKPEIEGSDQVLTPEAAAKEASTDVVPILAPNHWQKEAKDVFNSLPRDVQAAIVKREKDQEKGVQKKLREIEQSKKLYGELENEIGPSIEAWNLNGVHPTQVIRQLVAAQNYLQRDPVNAIIWLAKSYGIDLSGLASRNSAPQTSAGNVDPSLLQYVQAMQSEIHQLKSIHQNTALSATEKEIESFAFEKDANGNPLRPYFEELSGEIQQLAPMIQARKPDASIREILNEAYESAAWMNADVRDAMLKMQSSSRESERKKKAEAALRASKSIAGSPNGTIPNVKANSLRDDLLAAYRESKGI